jgi:hypothetical protein
MRREDWFGLMILVFWQAWDGLLIPFRLGSLLLLHSIILTPHSNVPFAILGLRSSQSEHLVLSIVRRFLHGERERLT